MRIGYPARGCAASLAILLLGQACAAPTPRATPTATSGRMPVWQDHGEFSIGADTYAEGPRQQAVFGAHLGERGILPIQLLVVSRASRPVTLRRDRVALDCAVEMEDGAEITARAGDGEGVSTADRQAGITRLRLPLRP